MSIPKVRKPPKPKSPRAPRADDPGKRRCTTCGAERKIGEFRFVMPTLLDGVEYACGDVCYSDWQGKKKAEMTAKLGET